MTNHGFLTDKKKDVIINQKKTNNNWMRPDSVITRIQRRLYQRAGYDSSCCQGGGGGLGWASDNSEMLLNYFMSHKALGLGRREGEGKWRPEISTCLTGGVLLWNGLINCVQGDMTTWVRSYLRSQKWGVGTLSFILPLPMDTENEGYCYRWNMQWESAKNSFFLLFFGTSPIVGYLFILFNFYSTCKHRCPVHAEKLFHRVW